MHHSSDLPQDVPSFEFIPFSAESRMRGVNVGSKKFRKGSIDAVVKFTSKELPYDIANTAKLYAEQGGTPLIVSDEKQALGIILLKDVVKKGLFELFKRFRSMG